MSIISVHPLRFHGLVILNKVNQGGDGSGFVESVSFVGNRHEDDASLSQFRIPVFQRPKGIVQMLDEMIGPDLDSVPREIP